MSFLLILATAGATYIAHPRTTLDAQEIIDLGIVASAHNFEYELQDAPSPLFVNLELSGFTACQIKGVEINVIDEVGTTMFGSLIAANRGNTYTFRMEREYLNSTRLVIICNAVPTQLEHAYRLKLGDIIKAP